MHDVIIIGAGVSDAVSTRELSRYKVNACVLEQEEDACCGTSKANNTIAHAGYDAAEGSLMTRLNVEENQIMPELTKGLDFPFNPCRSFVICLDEEPLPDLRASYERGVKSGAKDSGIIADKTGIKEMEPDLTDEVAGVLYTPTAGIVCPFNLNTALAENTYINGVNFKLNTEVTDIRGMKGGWALETNQGVYETRYVVNAAGVHADKFHNMVSGTKVHTAPRRGDYCLLDGSAGNRMSRTIFALSGKYGEGVLVPPTVYGNLVVGPIVIDIEDKGTTATTRGGLDELITKVGINVKGLLTHQIIISFTRLRAHENHHEFIIKELENTPGFIDRAGVESLGLTDCPAIERMAAGILKEKLELEPDAQSNDNRKGTLDPDTLTKEEQAELVKQNPAHRNIICRCEMVTEGGILDATHKPLGACSLNGIKRRIRAGVGRCQVRFCIPRSAEPFRRELGLPVTKITKAGGDSKFVVGTNRNKIWKRARAR